MDALRLERLDFDNMLTRNQDIKQILGTFVDDENGKTAHEKVNDFLNKMGPVQIERAYDGNLYPQFRTVKVEVT